LPLWRRGVTQKARSGQFRVNLEANVAISLVNHFALLIGPFCDISLSGSAETTGGGTQPQEGDFSLTAFGLALSLVGYLP
jgi:hypothetical protein